MKSLYAYISEALDIYRLYDVEATYFVNPNEIILECPESFNESNVQIYMNDLWLEALPTGKDNANKYFGLNKDNITDVFFEYDSYEHLSVEPKDYIHWDSKFGGSTNKDEELNYFKIKNLKYKIAFDRFDLTDVDNTTFEENLIKIFTAAESNTENEYPIEIQFDKDSLKYRK